MTRMRAPRTHAREPAALHALAELVRYLGQIPGPAGSDLDGMAGRVSADLPTDLPASLPASIPDDLARKHLLAPLASRLGLARFRKDFIANALFAAMREKTLAEAVAALSGRQIPVILLKGISYAATIYADPAERPMSDIDLLVPPAAHGDAARVLGRLGYWRAGSHRQTSRMHHAVCFKRKHAAIDLHRSIVQPLRSRIDIAGLWRRARPAAERADPAMRLDPVDEAVLHLAHMARHELRVPAINYIDAARLVARVPHGRERVLARARAFRIGRATHAALAMTRALVHGTPLKWPILLSVLPGTAEILAFGPIARPRQLVRKVALVEGPAQLLGLFAAGLHGALAHRIAP